MKKYQRYVPILKTKAGERWAIDNLPSQTKTRITPLFEVPTHKTKADEAHLEDLCEELATDWGTSQTFFLDLIWLHGDAGSASTLASAFELAHEFDLKAVPVVRLTFDETTLEQIAEIVENDGRGCLLRLRRPQFGNTAAIAQALDAVGLECGDVDLLLDYRAHSMHLAHDLPTIPNINEWRTLTAASGVFPGSLADFQLETWQQIDRDDYISWENAVLNEDLPRRPAFGDYTLRDPGPPPGGGAPRVCLRYAREQEWWVYQGGRVMDGAAEDMHDVCESLVDMTHVYCGQQYSRGDAEIWDCAHRASTSGGAQQWLQWCINHHIQLTTNQLQAVAVP